MSINESQTIDTILKESRHKLIAIGRKAMNMQDYDFKSSIELYPEVSDLLNVL